MANPADNLSDEAKAELARLQGPRSLSEAVAHSESDLRKTVKQMIARVESDDDFRLENYAVDIEKLALVVMLNKMADSRRPTVQERAATKVIEALSKSMQRQEPREVTVEPEAERDELEGRVQRMLARRNGASDAGKD